MFGRPLYSSWFRIVALLGASLNLESRATRAAEEPDFERTVGPLLVRRCLECHGESTASGGLVLAHRDKAFAGGESGAAVVPGKPEESNLLDRVASGEMPPEKNGKTQALPPEEVGILRDWIAAGAKWPEGRVLDPFEKTTEKRGGRDWWSLQPVRHVDVPSAPPGYRVANPIDAFVATKLVANKMVQAPAADRRTLLRRVYADLIGLPPSIAEVEAFLADHSANAYEKVVDRLLASPQFGERWARYWLDVARFAETNGYERDAVKPQAWRYRDWVIDAINTDMPYDRFVTEQLAGDELPDRNESTVVATGFIRLGTWDDEPNDPQEYQYERLEDMVHATSTAFLALTVKCARCHDHKFDPILQTDYYRMAGAFWAGPVVHRNRDWNGGPTREELGFDVLGWTDLSREPPALHLLKKGDIHRPGPAVAPGSLSAVPSLSREFTPAPADAKTSRRRLQLAEWIVDPQNPLTPRVIVNRLWQHHFGEGIVRTPDNFGFAGAQPTHADLLDYLATDLIAGGWKLKRLHKLMVMSETYRQASIHPEQASYDQRDAGNLLWWRAERRRLDAEAIRDAILVTAGQLDARRGGPSFVAPISGEALEGLSMKSGGYKASPPEESRRRSVYMFTKRGIAVPLMTTFDACETTLPAGRRDVTIVAPQALALMNNEWVHEQSQFFARRVLSAARQPSERVDAAWQFALGRRPSETERAAALAHVEKLLGERQLGEKPPAEKDSQSNVESAWASLCRVLLNTNEFVYID